MLTSGEKAIDLCGVGRFGDVSVETRLHRSFHVVRLRVAAHGDQADVVRERGANSLCTS